MADSASAFCNKGNFLAILDYSIKSGNDALAKHLNETSRNALYTSKTTQNQIIGCIGEHIRDKIITEIKEAKWYSLLCDGASNMSSAGGVQGLTSAENSKAVYVHCNSHILNL